MTAALAMTSTGCRLMAGVRGHEEPPVSPTDAGGDDGSRRPPPRPDAGGAPDASDADGRSPSGEICDNGIDDNGDGQIDENCECKPGTRQQCYPGATRLAGIGICAYGVQDCMGTDEFGYWGPCQGARLPGVEICDGLDNDCNGRADEGCACTPGDRRACYGGPAATRQIGVCADGVQTCVPGPGGAGSDWGPCTGDVEPATEVCDGVDNDCNGTVDDGCACRLGASRSCYGGPAGTAGVGPCAAGTQTCVATGGGAVGWGACTGQVVPGPEICDGTDNNCNGVADDGCACTPGASRACYDGPAGTRGVGLCADGTQVCVAGPGGVGSSWGPCTGARHPTPEICDDLDQNCDGVIDDGCACRKSDTRACYDGPAGTANVGVCRPGTQGCVVANGTASWGACTGETLPAAAEICNALDDNCNGKTDENLARSCGVSNVGDCRLGTQTCSTGVWGACLGEVDPAPEDCNGGDENCNGQVDEGCSCLDGTTIACGSSVGACKPGTQSCVNGQYGACTGATGPKTETCNGVDDDCDGVVDNGCVCRMGDARSCYSGPTGTAGVGVCKAGTQSCVVASGQASWGPCTAQVLPAAETCNNLDDDCNGKIDDGLARSCGVSNVGDCRLGTQTCAAGSWGACVGEVDPKPEDCNGGDENCNGQVDEGCSCLDGTKIACGSTVGACKAGTQTCVNGQFGACTGAVGPTPEICNDIDDDCDGVIDNGCVCRKGQTRPCYDGPPGTSGVGLCAPGTQSCVVQNGTASWGVCTGEVLPSAEICDGSDDDCNGQSDDRTEIPAQNLTTEMLLVLDRSASMLDIPTGASTSKWNIVVPTVDQIVTNTNASIAWGLKLFPDLPGPGGQCTTTLVSTAMTVPIAPQDAAVITAGIAATTPTGTRTPTGDAIRIAAAYLASRPTNNPRYILLVTDGFPNCTQQGTNDDTNQGPAVSYAISAITDAAANGFHTFVIGIDTTDPGETQTLNQMAIAGLEPAADPAQSFYLASAQAPLAAALAAITDGVVRCGFTLSAPPPHPDAAVLTIGGQVAPRDPTHQNGWDYTGTSFQGIRVYGPLCDAVKAGAPGSVRVVVGCP